MGFSRDDSGQLILLAGVLVVLAFLLFSTQSALTVNIGQESGRQASNPLLSDFGLVRSSLATTLPLEMTDSNGIIRCPTDTTDWGGRVQALVGLLAQLEGNRGQVLIGHYVSVTITDIAEPSPDPYPSLNHKQVSTRVDFFLSSGDASFTDKLSLVSGCEA